MLHGGSLYVPIDFGVETTTSPRPGQAAAEMDPKNGTPFSRARLNLGRMAGPPADQRPAPVPRWRLACQEMAPVKIVNSGG